MNLSFSQAAENNKTPILAILARAFIRQRQVLEIGSGTGQHAVHFAKALHHLMWQTSDLPENHDAIKARLSASAVPNALPPLIFDLAQSAWPGHFDAVFSANTAHIVSWQLVEKMFELVGRNLPQAGMFALYGPFNYGGKYTSESNREFDAWLKSRDARSGIRDFEKICALAEKNELTLLEDNAMPANNRLLIFRKGV